MLFRKSPGSVFHDCEKAEIKALERYYQASAAARDEYARIRGAIEMRRMDAFFELAERLANRGSKS